MWPGASSVANPDWPGASSVATPAVWTGASSVANPDGLMGSDLWTGERHPAEQRLPADGIGG